MSFKKCLPVILAGVGSVGVVATAVCSAKNTTKFEQSVKPDDKKENFKLFMKCYWPTILVGAGAIASVAVGTILSKKTEASLTAALGAIGAGYTKYQNKVKQHFGTAEEKKILADLAKDECKGLPSKKDNKILYYNNYIGKFYATPEDVNKAIINMNMRLCSSPESAMLPQDQYWRTTIGEFAEDCNAEILDQDIFNAWKDFGWSSEYLADLTDDIWIYDGFCDEAVDGVNARVLTFYTEEPILNPKNWDHNQYIIKKSEQWHGTDIEEIQSGAADSEAPNEN